MDDLWVITSLIAAFYMGYHYRDIGRNRVVFRYGVALLACLFLGEVLDLNRWLTVLAAIPVLLVVEWQVDRRSDVLR